MAKLNGLTVIHTTENKKNADTDSPFRLLITRSGLDLELPFKNLPHNERERGRTDQYVFDLSAEDVDSDAADFQVAMRILGSDGWQPSSIFVIGHHPGGGAEVLGSHPKWDKGPFDNSTQRVISGFS